MKIAALMIGMTIASAAHADEPAWINVAQSNNATYALKRGSCSFEKEVILCIERQLKKDSGANFTLVGTNEQSCKAGMGKLMTFTIDGKQVLSNNDVVSEGGTVAAMEFDFLCLVIAQRPGTKI